MYKCPECKERLTTTVAQQLSNISGKKYFCQNCSKYYKIIKDGILEVIE